MKTSLVTWVQAAALRLLVGLRSILGGRFSDTRDPRVLERNRRLIMTSIASLGGKALSMAVNVVSVPLALSYLDKERYGLWLSISTTVALLGFADLGVGNALLNRISAAYGEDDREGARKDFWSAAALLTVVAIAIGLIFVMVWPLIDWARVFNVRSSVAIHEAGPSVAIVIACYLAGLPLSLAQTTRSAYQEGYLNVAWGALASVLGLAGLYVSVRNSAPLPLLALVMSAFPLLGTAANLGTLLGFSRPWLRPTLEDFAWSRGALLLRKGLAFLILQATIAIGFNIDNLIIAQVLGSEAVVSYGLAARLFLLTGTLATILLSPLWPAYAEAIATGDVRWVRKALTRSLLGAALSTGLMGPVLVVLGPWLLRLWTGTHLEVSRTLLIPFAVWMLVSTVGHAAGVFLNARGILRFQVITASCLTILMVGLKVALGKQYGAQGVAWASSLAYLATTAIPASWVIAVTLRRLPSREHTNGL